MIDLFLDTDCISSFLWVCREDILLKLYKGRIIIPKQVFNELSNPKVPHIGKKVNCLLGNKDINVKEIMLDTNEYNYYQELTNPSKKGLKIIGNGEAAAISLSKANNGIIASNNLKDIMKYVKKFKLNHITTGDILIEALKAELINESDGNQIWGKMLLKKRKLPTLNFSDYLKKQKNK